MPVLANARHMAVVPAVNGSISRRHSCIRGLGSKRTENLCKGCLAGLARILSWIWALGLAFGCSEEVKLQA